MESYEIWVKPSASREIEWIGSRNDRARIVQRIRSLAENPRARGCEKLTGSERFRVRQGNFRIAYRVDDPLRVVETVKVGHRRDLYR